MQTHPPYPPLRKVEPKHCPDIAQILPRYCPEFTQNFAPLFLKVDFFKSGIL